MKLLGLVAFSLALIVNCHGELERFDNHVVYEVVPKTSENARFLYDLMKSHTEYDFWRQPSSASETTIVRVDPKGKDKFVKLLESGGMEYKVLIDDVQKLVEAQNVTSFESRQISRFDWLSYHTLEDIYRWIDHIVAENPSIASRVVGGRSYEGREIVGVKLSRGSNRKAIMLECGIHAREWIAPATATFIINALITNNDAAVRDIANSFDWYIFPVVNPDGYVFSHTTNRMWRKTRSPQRNNAWGVDPNRNWNIDWGLNGTSNMPLSDTYGGPGPFSEIETRTFSEFIRSVAPNLEMYLSFHSFSQLLLIPYGSSFLPQANYWDAVRIGRRAMGYLRQRYNTNYNVGNIAEAIYAASGGSIDWVKATFNIPLVYLYELRDDGQTGGFLLPANQIIPNSLEVLDSLVGLIEEGRKDGYLR